jgi:hypothetical protein
MLPFLIWEDLKKNLQVLVQYFLYGCYTSLSWGCRLCREEDRQRHRSAEDSFYLNVEASKCYCCAR